MALHVAGPPIGGAGVAGALLGKFAFGDCEGLAEGVLDGIDGLGCGFEEGGGLFSESIQF